METEATVSEFQDMLSARGVTRRSFMKLCGAVAAAAGLSELAAPQIAQALEKSVIGATKGKLYPVIWIEGASCTGCTESFAQVETPDPASVVLELISLNYSRDAFRGCRLVDGGSQGADDRGRQLHPRVRGCRAGGLGRPGAARCRQARHGAPDRGCGEGQRRGGAGFLRRQRRVDGRPSEQLGRARRAAVPGEGRHRCGRHQHPGLPGEPRVARVRARGRDHAREAAPAHQRGQARGHLRPDDP